MLSPHYHPTTSDETGSQPFSDLTLATQLVSGGSGRRNLISLFPKCATSHSHSPPPLFPPLPHVFVRGPCMQFDPGQDTRCPVLCVPPAGEGEATANLELCGTEAGVPFTESCHARLLCAHQPSLHPPSSSFCPCLVWLFLLHLCPCGSSFSINLFHISTETQPPPSKKSLSRHNPPSSQAHPEAFHPEPC